MKDISVVIPCIRTKNLPKVYEALKGACHRHSFEVIFVGPYLIPEELLKTHNVTYIHTYVRPTSAAQMAISLASGEFLYLTADDGLVQDGAIDSAIDLFRSELGDDGIINMKYHEAALDVDTLEKKPDLKDFPKDYWYPWAHPELRIAGINPSWIMALQFLIKTDYFCKLGGFDCGFEILNYSLHDFVYRAQENGSRVLTSETDAFLCSHLSHHNGDHGPIHDAAVGPDREKFYSIYTQERAAEKRIELDYNNWKDYSKVWERRFDVANLPL